MLKFFDTELPLGQLRGAIGIELASLAWICFGSVIYWNIFSVFTK